MKYMRRKAKISKDISPIINRLIENNNINTYIEPFVGGANMIEHIKCNNKYGYDNNEYLIAMWKATQRGWRPPSELSREEYQNIKDNQQGHPKELVAIAGFCATYNAKWFGGYAGIVHTKANTIRNYYDEAIRNILKQRDNILDVKFDHIDYRTIDIENALIYCDPPYQNTTKYKDDFNHDEYWDWVRDMSDKNIVLCSEYNAPDDFDCIYEKTLTTTLDKNSRKKDTEKLFVHRNNSNLIKQ